MNTLRHPLEHIAPLAGLRLAAIAAGFVAVGALIYAVFLRQSPARI